MLLISCFSFADNPPATAEVAIAISEAENLAYTLLKSGSSQKLFARALLFCAESCPVSKLSAFSPELFIAFVLFFKL